ncbi:MAG: elongation factor P [Chloroflexi bacterium]|nr:elongation factor P [Chloroflexota bacterium]
MEISEVSRNTKLLIDGAPHNVEDFDFVKPGKGRGIYHLKVRNLMTSALVDLTYHSGDKMEEARVSAHDMQYLYAENDDLVFMDTETYEQHTVPKERVGDKKYFLKENMVVTVLMWDERPIDISLPKAVELKVVNAGMGASKTQTVTAQLKDAVTETGYTVGVPAFVKEGDTIRVSTVTGAYVERVSTKE